MCAEKEIERMRAKFWKLMNGMIHKVAMHDTFFYINFVNYSALMFHVTIPLCVYIFALLLYNC